MGQYFMPCIIDSKGAVIKAMYSHEYGNGLKLMEHSYIDNEFVSAFEILLAMDGPARVVWAGDYADEEKDGENLYHHAQRYDGETGKTDDSLLVRMNIPAFQSDRFYSLPEDTRPTPDFDPPFIVTAATHPYVINHDERLYVDKGAVASVSWTRRGEEPLRIHPLPLLTAEGNGRGGGDYRGDDPDLIVGSWARNRISVGQTIPEGFTELKFTINE